MKTLTYGTLPTFQEFADAFARENDGLFFEISLPRTSTDYTNIQACGLLPLGYVQTVQESRRIIYHFTAQQLYSLLQSLCAIADGHYSHGEPWSDDAMEWAGDFASSIMSTLRFEWV